MQTKNTFQKRNGYLLLAACIFCFAAGILVLTIGAVHHRNPQLSFAGLFNFEVYRNLVFSLIPGIN